MSAAVAWSTLDGNSVEKILAVMLNRRFSNGYRIRPSRGDRGIDVAVPTDNGKVDVYQIKGFSANLTSSQKKQIRDSLAAVLQQRDFSVASWHLVLPLDPTPENKRWLKELAATLNVPFLCHWKGLSFVEGLASESACVVDYYLRAGRTQLEQHIVALRELIGLSSDSTTDRLLSPQDIQTKLAAAYRLINDADPHYRYEFHVGALPAAQTHDLPDDLVAIRSESFRNEWVNISVFKRYPSADEDAPIPITLNWDQVTLSDEEAQKLLAAQAFGSGFSLPSSASLGLSVQLPGGLSFQSSAAALAALPTPVAGGRGRWVLAPEPGGIGVAECAVGIREVTRGDVGVRILAREEEGVFDAEFTVRPSPINSAGSWEVALRVRDLTGKPAKAIAPGCQFAWQFRRPNILHAGLRHGPKPTPELKLTAESPPIDESTWSSVTALAALQDFADDILYFAEPSLFEAERLHIWRRVLSGDIVQANWTSTSARLERKAVADWHKGDEIDLWLTRRDRFTWRGVTVHLPAMDYEYRSALVEEIQSPDEDDYCKVDFISANSTVGIVRLSLTPEG